MNLFLMSKKVKLKCYYYDIEVLLTLRKNKVRQPPWCREAC